MAEQMLARSLCKCGVLAMEVGTGTGGTTYLCGVCGESWTEAPVFPDLYIGPQEDDLPDGEPCGHPGCLSHITHPCEGCGRIAGRSGDSHNVDTRRRSA